MTHGARIRNGNAIVQIDYRYSNMAVYSKGTVTTSGNNGWGWATTTVNIPGPAGALLACNGQTIATFAIVGARPYNGGTSYTFYSKGPMTINWWLFATPQENPGGIGFRVRDPVTGAVYFNSNMKYMKLSDVKVGSMGSGLNGGFTATYGERNIAVVQGMLPIENLFIIFDQYQGYFNTDFGVMSVYKAPGQASRVDYRPDNMLIDGPYDPDSVIANDNSQWYYNLMMIDVTGY